MKLFCKLPFTRISIDDNGYVWPACCPDWVAFPLGNVFDQSWEEIWMGDAATVFRSSMLDGSLRFCDRQWCPHIADATSGISNTAVIPYQKGWKKWTPAPPVHVNLNYDPTCNLKCPTCRHELIHYRGKHLEKVIQLHEFVEQNILPQVSSVALTGVGDPFMSRVFRKFLMEFSKEKYPHIRHMHLHTNGLLFDEKSWQKMPGLRDVELSADISIDAATEATYQKVRPPGEWLVLMQNLQFIKSIPNLKELGISMVVQQANFSEMETFVELGASLSKKGRLTFVEFKRARQYYHLNNEQYARINVGNLSDVEFSLFKSMVAKIDATRRLHELKHLTPAIRHNLHEFLEGPCSPERINLLRKVSDFPINPLLKR
jgi:MoaA/NifB/PqqE/SkfB family radical SAM enzyme